MSKWKTKNRHKFLLQYHLILVCKYRKNLLSSNQVSEDIKNLSKTILKRYNVLIKHMETDKDHIHYMIELNPDISVSKVVRLLKRYTTFHIWEKSNNFLSKHFWREKTFWSDGYFVCTVGNVSEKMLKEYIENQG